MNQNTIAGTGTDYDPCTDPFEICKILSKYKSSNFYAVSSINDANKIENLSTGDTILEESTGLLYYWSDGDIDPVQIGNYEDPTKIWVDSLISNLVSGLKIDDYYRYQLTCPSWLAKRIKKNKNGNFFGDIIEDDSTNDIEIKIKFGEK